MTSKSMITPKSRVWQICAFVCAFTVLPIGIADAKRKKANTEEADKKKAERAKAQQIYTKKIESWDRKLKTAVKDGIITEKEARTKMGEFKKQLVAQKLAEKKAAEKKAADKKAADKKAADKKKAGSKKPVKKQVKKKPEPLTAAEMSKKLREEVKAGKLTKKEAKEKIKAYKEKLGGKAVAEKKSDRKKKK